MSVIMYRFEKSSKWMKRYARPLELARWTYHFDGGQKEDVLRILAAFQNEDGGFGHGIEPDFWLPKSSPMATWAAGQVLMEVDADSNDLIVQKMISYLIKNYNHDTGMWTSVLPENNDYPHAIWWNWSEDVQKNWMFNPSAELAAFLIHWSPENSDGAHVGWSSIEKAIERLMNASQMDKHEIQNFQALTKIMQKYENEFNRRLSYSFNSVCDKVYELIENCMEKDPSKWSTGYLPLPLDFIDGPEHPLFEKNKTLVEQNIQFFLDELKEDGYWDVSWGWGMYPDEYPIARRYWQGILTVNRYKLLKNFY